jgi:hypothetical protein
MRARWLNESKRQPSGDSSPRRRRMAAGLWKPSTEARITCRPRAVSSRASSPASVVLPSVRRARTCSSRARFRTHNPPSRRRTAFTSQLRHYREGVGDLFWRLSELHEQTRGVCSPAVTFVLFVASSSCPSCPSWLSVALRELRVLRGPPSSFVPFVPFVARVLRVLRGYRTSSSSTSNTSVASGGIAPGTPRLP